MARVTELEGVGYPDAACAGIDEDSTQLLGPTVELVEE